MRHLILIAATLLVAVSAHAEETRGLIKIASTDTAQQTQPATAARPAVAAETGKSEAPKVETVEETAPAAKPIKAQTVRKRETDEQKARRIAARYGIYW
jgi:uncharacterized membrane protein YqiK